MCLFTHFLTVRTFWTKWNFARAEFHHSSETYYDAELVLKDISKGLMLLPHLMVSALTWVLSLLPLNFCPDTKQDKGWTKLIQKQAEPTPETLPFVCVSAKRYHLSLKNEVQFSFRKWMPPCWSPMSCCTFKRIFLCSNYWNWENCLEMYLALPSPSYLCTACTLGTEVDRQS